MVGVNGSNGATWEELTLTQIEEARERQKLAKEQQKRYEQEATYWGEYADTLAKALDMNRQHRVIPIDAQRRLDPQSLVTKSVREALIEIATANDGLLVALMAVQVLVDAGMFKDREHARNSIYTTLHYAKKYFKKERPGIYRLLKTQKQLNM